MAKRRNTYEIQIIIFYIPDNINYEYHDNINIYIYIYQLQILHNVHKSGKYYFYLFEVKNFYFMYYKFRACSLCMQIEQNNLFIKKYIF